MRLELFTYGFNVFCLQIKRKFISQKSVRIVPTMKPKWWVHVFFVNRDPIWHSVCDVNLKAGTLLATRFVTIQDDLASCLPCIAGSVTKTSQQVCMSVVRSCVGL